MSSVTFVNGLYIQTSLAVNCLPAASDQYYHTYAQKWFKKKKIFFLYFHIQEVLSHSRESDSISGRLPDNPGGFTCMLRRMLVCLACGRSRVQSSGPATFFRGDWSWNHFYGHSLPTADSSRAVVSYWQKDVHLVLVNCLGSLPRNSVVRLTDLSCWLGRKMTNQTHKTIFAILKTIRIHSTVMIPKQPLFGTPKRSLIFTWVCRAF